jgi:hypothetical protein
MILGRCATLLLWVSEQPRKYSAPKVIHYCRAYCRTKRPGGRSFVFNTNVGGGAELYLFPAVELWEQQGLLAYTREQQVLTS